MCDYLILVLGAPDSSVLYLGHYDPVLATRTAALRRAC
jgi:hypothetical protein